MRSRFFKATGRGIKNACLQISHFNPSTLFFAFFIARFVDFLVWLIQAPVIPLSSFDSCPVLSPTTKLRGQIEANLPGLPLSLTMAPIFGHSPKLTMLPSFQALVLAMSLHAKGKAYLKRETYDLALLILLEADSEFKWVLGFPQVGWSWKGEDGVYFLKRLIRTP